MCQVKLHTSPSQEEVIEFNIDAPRQRFNYETYHFEKYLRSFTWQKCLDCKLKKRRLEAEM